MMNHILIPSSDSYGVMLLITLSLGSFPIARHVHIRWLKNYFSFVGSNAVVKSSIVILGLFTVNLSHLFAWNIYRELSGLFIGVIFGLITLFVEMKVIRMINRKRLINKTYKQDISESRAIRNAIITKKTSLFSTKSMQAKGLTQVRQGYGQYTAEPDFLNYSLLSVIIVAIAEEFLFRGYIISITELMPNEIIFILVFLSTILFACSHMANSWIEFVCKLPLSLLTLVGFILTGTLLTAIFTHITLNICAYLQLKKLNLKDLKQYCLPAGVVK